MDVRSTAYNTNPTTTLSQRPGLPDQRYAPRAVVACEVRHVLHNGHRGNLQLRKQVQALDDVDEGQTLGGGNHHLHTCTPAHIRADTYRFTGTRTNTQPTRFAHTHTHSALLSLCIQREQAGQRGAGPLYTLIPTTRIRTHRMLARQTRCTQQRHPACRHADDTDGRKQARTQTAHMGTGAPTTHADATHMHTMQAGHTSM